MAEQAGDYESSSKFSYPSLMEAQIRRLRLNLEDSKELVLIARGVLAWEKNWHPTALMGGSTILFTLLWLLDPSILTVVSTLGLFLTVSDYLIPSLSSSLCKRGDWTPQKDKELENICTDLVIYKTKLELNCGRYYKLRTTNRKMYFVGTITGLGLLAWIGCTFNNLFLAYILVTFLLLLPGMERNGIMCKASSYAHGFLSEVMKQARTKQEKKE